MAHSPIITLTTDFGAAAPYAAVMKGVILSINPNAAVVDLSHSIRAQDLRHASYFLETAIPHFPHSAIHVCVIDPGVGSERAPVYVEVAGHRLIGPDNGIFTGLIRKSGKPTSVRRLANHKFWRAKTSYTFHGRDIFAPVAAHLSLGVDPEQLGPVHESLFELAPCSAVTFENRWRGEVQFIDEFGNLITNIPVCKMKTLPTTVSIGDHPGSKLRWVRTYSDAATGDLVCLFSSDGYFEIAEVNGNAAARLGVKVGTTVELKGEQ
jgi:S-adenosylmethionine hydrolase